MAFVSSAANLFRACEVQIAGALRIGVFEDVGISVEGGYSHFGSDIRVLDQMWVDSRLGPAGVKEWAQDVALHVFGAAADGPVAFAAALEDLRSAVPAFAHGSGYISKIDRPMPIYASITAPKTEDRWPSFCRNASDCKSSDSLALLVCAALGSEASMFFNLLSKDAAHTATVLAIELFMYRLNQAVGLIPADARIPTCRDKSTLYFNWDVGCITVPAWISCRIQCALEEGRV